MRFETQVQPRNAEAQFRGDPLVILKYGVSGIICDDEACRRRFLAVLVYPFTTQGNPRLLYGACGSIESISAALICTFVFFTKR